MGIWFVLLGMAIGSFLNVVADRLPWGGSLLSPPSQCPNCSHHLSPLELIPVASYFWLRGRCRHCGSRIPVRVLIVELTTGAVFGLVWQRYGASLDTLVIAAFAAFLIAVFVIDLEHRRILNVMTYPALIFGVLAMPLFPGRDWRGVLIGGALGFGILLVIALVSRGGMGMGDVKLAAVIGIFVGYPTILLALFLAVMLGGLVSGGLLIAKVIGRRDPIAFGPFLAAGGIVTLLYGEQMIAWWMART